ncbi:MAG: YbaN family protein [Selenomonadales bacterium]|nr:YbaN family protein [Selenomonadales bacterium]
MQQYTRLLLAVGGTIALALGIVGIFLPGLPTTPFLLLSAWCYARSSPRLYTWLMQHPVLGTYIRDYLERRGVPLRAKILALALLWPSIIVTAVFATRLLHARLALFFIAAAVSVHILKLKTLRP